MLGLGLALCTNKTAGRLTSLGFSAVSCDIIAILFALFPLSCPHFPFVLICIICNCVHVFNIKLFRNIRIVVEVSEI